MANNTLLASDYFASGALAAGWSTMQGGTAMCSVIVGSPNVTEPAALSTQYGQVWTDLTWPNDQVSEFTINLTSENNTYGMLLLRQQAGSRSGYQLNIANTNVTIYRYDNGTPTSILSVNGLTFAAGDIWAFSASGSCLSVYQNFKLIGQFYDATYTSGRVGYAQYTGIDLTHTKVLSWRGYSAVQQDGIWTKKQITIPALAGDLPIGVFIPTQVLYEGNAQLIAPDGSGNVYKVWFGSGSATHPGIYYAESTDGINWTRNSATAPVIASQWGPAVMKVGSTYYMYTQPGPTGFGSADFALYTSTDGITWMNVSSTILAVGAGGSWDAAQMYSFAPVAIIGGTWYALYSASPNTSLNGKTGLATSPDGVTWTKYASNPVLTGYITQATYKVGSLWYTWIQQTQPGQGQTTIDPTECVRYSSPDLIVWTKSAQSIHHSTLNEGVNGINGQSFINSIINIGGKAYGYTDSEPNDAASPQIYQIGLVTAPSTIDQIVTQPEDAAQQTQSDAFTSGIGSLSANWSAVTGLNPLQIIAGNLVEGTVLSTIDEAVYTGITFSSNQYSEITVHTLVAGSVVSLLLNSLTAARTNYQADIGTTSTRIYKVVAGVAVQIGPSAVLTVSSGDIFRFSVIVGSDGFPVLSVFQNGFLLLQVQDQSSTPLTGGNPGFAIHATTSLANAQVSSWAGGNANVMPFGVISGNAGIAGATISYSGATSGSVTADGSGNYTLPNLANGMYTLTPTLAGYTFSPTSATENISNGNITGVNFTATVSNNSKNSLMATNNLLSTNGLLVTNTLLTPNLLGGTNDWS